MDVALHESLFECATTAWISADAFMSERLDFRKPAIHSCLEIAAASAALGKKLLNNDFQPLEDFRNSLRKSIKVLDEHCQDAEHCLITLKCWKQMDDLLKTMH
jgi:hypothetical protein